MVMKDWCVMNKHNCVFVGRFETREEAEAFIGNNDNYCIAEWVIRTRETGDIIDCFKTREEAEKTLEQWLKEDEENCRMTIFGRAITDKDMEIIATYMDDEIREYLHANGCTDTPEEFICAYLDLRRDPAFYDIIVREFDFKEGEEFDPDFYEIWNLYWDFDEIKMILREYLPAGTDENLIDADFIDEIKLRIDGLDRPRERIKACVDYILDYGDGDVGTGFGLLINELDDDNIWCYMEGE